MREEHKSSEILTTYKTEHVCVTKINKTEHVNRRKTKLSLEPEIEKYVPEEKGKRD